MTEEISSANKTQWFPVHISDMDKFSSEVLEYGGELSADHPGFSDTEYRQRRVMIAQVAKDYLYGSKFPVVEYTETENGTWDAVYRKLNESHKRHAHSVYLRESKQIEFPSHNVPSLAEVSNALHEYSGFVLRPVSGLLSARDFLNALAIKVFHCTQYIRHHSKPMYTPEPDIVHEMLGHLPLLMDPTFAKLTQMIGLLSLGVTDDQIDKLAHLYWFTVEYGMSMDTNRAKEQSNENTNANSPVKAIGAGLLSSYGELENAFDCVVNHHIRRVNNGMEEIATCQECNIFAEKFLSSHPDYNTNTPSTDFGTKCGDNEEHMHIHLHEFDCHVAATQEYPISAFQPLFMVISSFEEAIDQILEYSKTVLNIPLRYNYDESLQSIVEIDATKA